MKEIYELAKKAGACSPGLREIEKTASVNDLIRLLKTGKGIEFIMDSDFLNASVYNKYRKELEKECVFLDGTHALKNPRLLILIGGSVDIEVNGFQVCEVYAKSDAEINIVAYDNAYVSVEIHGSAVLTSEVYGMAKLKEYRK